MPDPWRGHRVFGVPPGLVAGNGAGQPAGTPRQEGSNFVVHRRCFVDISFAIRVACTWKKKRKK